MVIMVAIAIASIIADDCTVHNNRFDILHLFDLKLVNPCAASLLKIRSKAGKMFQQCSVQTVLIRLT